MSAETRPFRHLNRDGLWPGFTWEGLELDGAGVLRLMAVPRLDGPLPAAVPALASAQPAAGVAADADGTIYVTNPATHTLFRVDGCTKAIERAPCLGGYGSAPTRFSAPAGLLIPPHRRALYVADAGNGRIQIVDLATLALAQSLTGFRRPVSLAADDAGAIYVVDMGTHRVDRLSIAGDVEPSFWDRVRESGTIHEPVAVACDGPHVLVLDARSHDIVILDREGRRIAAATAPAGARTFTARRGTIYAADPARRRLAVLRRNQNGRYVTAGDAAGYDGPVAALACHEDTLLLLPGAGVTPLRLVLDGSYRHEGWLTSKAIRVDGVPHFWNRLHADLGRPDNSHVQFFVHTGPLSAPPPSPAADPVPAPWRPAPGDADDLFLTFDGAKSEALWIAARFANDAHVTPALAQLRVDFDQESYLPYLPAIYRARECGDLLLRYLSLFESFFDELESDTEALPALVDPAAADPSALAWLAGFLALPLPETWSDRQRREAVAGAYERYARRGTVAGLRETLRVEAGVRATIDEPIQGAGWWAAGGPSLLGVDTVLASAEAQGAVVGTTATLDRSQLIAAEEFGLPLFDAVAHRFTVQLYPGEASGAGTLDRVRAIVDREKPAHTDYDVCVLEPGIRVGFRARLGVDTLLGEGRAPRRLGAGGLVLGGPPPSRLGKESRIGVGTHL
jgi:phage tail-like protein